MSHLYYSRLCLSKLKVYVSDRGCFYGVNKGGCLINNKQKQIFKAEGKTKGGTKSTVELKHILTHNSSNTAAKQKLPG